MDQSFNGVGLPLLQINHTRLSEDGGTWWWHTPEDTLDKIDLDILETDTELYGNVLAALLAAETLPIELTAQAELLGRAIAERQRSAGRVASYFVKSLERQQRLLEAVTRVEQSLGKVTGPGIDLAVLRVQRSIQRVLYVPLNLYHPDPGVNLGPLPGLAPATTVGTSDPAGDRYGFAATSLRRECNRLEEALDVALAEAERLFERLSSQ